MNNRSVLMHTHHSDSYSPSSPYTHSQGSEAVNEALNHYAASSPVNSVLLNNVLAE